MGRAILEASRFNTGYAKRIVTQSLRHYTISRRVALATRKAVYVICTDIGSTTSSRRSVSLIIPDVLSLMLAVVKSSFAAVFAEPDTSGSLSSGEDWRSCDAIFYTTITIYNQSYDPGGSPAS